MFYDAVSPSRIGPVGTDLNSVRQRMVRIRLTLAINLFKRYILGPDHLPNKPQVDELLSSVHGSRLFELIDIRTWISWFEPKSPVPKRKTVRALDQIAREGIRIIYPAADTAYGLAPGFFEELVHGGLLQTMTTVAPTKRTKFAVMAAVSSYLPLSAWHLHLDSIEVCGHSEGIGDLGWEFVKRLAAERLMFLLSALWSPRRGTIFKLFATDFRLGWNVASDAERRELTAHLSSSPFYRFTMLMNPVPIPNWLSIGVDNDVPDSHIHKVMLALAADFEFLKAERLTAWALDLASAALAMHALAWTDRYETFGLRVSGEEICWWTFYSMFFSENKHEDLDGSSEKTMSYLGLLWSEQLCNVLRDGGSSYLREIDDLGLDVPSLVSVARRATDVHQLIYHGNPAHLSR